MNKKVITGIAGILTAILLTACGKATDEGQTSSEYTSASAAEGKAVTIDELKTAIQNFDSMLYELNTSLASLDLESGNDMTEFFSAIEQTDVEFQNLADLDLPKDFDHLESTADEAANFMAEAAKQYKEAFDVEPYDETILAKAKLNYYKAYQSAYELIKEIKNQFGGSEVE